MPRAPLVLTLFVLAGCAGAPTAPVVPKVVQVTVTRYAPVDARLVVPCPIEERTDDTAGEAARVARVRRASLEKCNSQLKEIAGLKGTQ